jgi:uncharacterized Zn finger protein
MPLTSQRRTDAMREAAFNKGRRYLVEGRLRIQAVSDRHVAAVCRGDSGVMHQLAVDHRSWSCSCPAAGGCSHLVALRLVTLRPLPLDGPGPNGPERFA